MKIDRGELIDALNKIKPGLAKNDIVEQSTSFVFDKKTVRTFNDSVNVQHAFKSGITGAIKADEFFRLVNKFKDEKIDLTVENSQLLIKGKNTEAALSIDEEIKLPELKIPGMNSKKWMKLPESFLDGIQICIFSASKNMIRPELTCLCVKDKYIFSTDSFRATVWDMKDEVDQDFLLPASAAAELKKYNPVKYMIDDNWLHFVNSEKTHFSCRLMSGLDKFPIEIIEKMMEVDGKEIALPDSLQDVLDRVQTLVSADFEVDRFVTVKIQKNALICHGKGPLGWVKEKVKIKYDGEEIEIKVQPTMLIQILEHLDKMTIGDKLLFDSKHFTHFICLST